MSIDWATDIGDKLVSKGGVEVNTQEAIAGCDLIGIYFSAHWCPPCRAFTPKFADVYKELAEKGKKFQCIFVSSDRDETQFNDYFADMPWLALPFNEREKKGQLGEKFGIRGIPTLLIVKPDGTLATKDGRSKVDGEGAGGYPWGL